LAEFGWSGRRTDRFIQLDAAISAGSSGGPIVDRHGAVIAVSTFVIVGGQALNFGVPAMYVSELLDLAGECRTLDNFCETPPASGSIPSDDSFALGYAGAPTLSGYEPASTDYLIRLLGLVMVADGELTDEEQLTMIAVANNWGLNDHEINAALARFSEDLTHSTLADLATEAALYLGAVLDASQKLMVLEDMIAVAQADEISVEEAYVIGEIRRLWGHI
jgi:uncharacterized tellurite resistance protein B-like protein